MQTALITGGNRGIGLALVKTFLEQRPVTVFATCRNPAGADALQQLATQYPQRLVIIALDVNDADSIAAAVTTVQQVTLSLDVLVNNAGIYPKDTPSLQLGQLEAHAVTEVLVTNAVAPVMVTQAYLPLLKQGNNPRVMMVSSYMGSITDNRSGNGIAYRMSKSAVNMAVKALSNTLKAEGVTVFTTHPGHVATDMGGASAPISPVESAKGLFNLVAQATLAQTGKFFNYTGDELPW